MPIFVELSLIIVIAAILSGLMRVLKQPLIMGYVLTGLVVGPFVLNMANHTETVDALAQMGIAILLFIVGLNLSPKVIKEVGKASIITAVIQMAGTFLFGLLISLIFKFNLLSCIYLATAFSFSSTIIVLKLLGEKHDLEKLYGKIAIGILLLQDVVATFVLVGFGSFTNGTSALGTTVLLIIKGLALTVCLVFISSKLLPKLSDFFAKSQEYLFLFSLAWGFGMASLFNWLGFSIEIGALVAGITLSVSPYNQEMGAKLKPLRDFFVVMFFVLLGLKMGIQNFPQLILPIIVFAILNILIKPFLITGTLIMLGFNRKVGFFAGIALSQVSEFSMILGLVGTKLGHIDNQTLSLLTLVGLVSIAVSSYLVMYSEKIYPHVSKYLKRFERKYAQKEITEIGFYDVLLFGCNRVGYDFIRTFKHLGKAFLAVDFNPEVVKELTEKGINCRYGDAEDPDFLDSISIERSKVVISTIPDYETNSYLISKVRKLSQKINIIVISYNIDEAIKLYEDGASYVILPHFIGGQYAADLAHKQGYLEGSLHKHRSSHIEYLKERKQLGHAHPLHLRHL